MNNGYVHFDGVTIDIGGSEISFSLLLFVRYCS